MSAALRDLKRPVHEIARPDPVRLREWETVAHALARLRDAVIEERIVYFYATDRDGRLVGVVPTRRLLLSEPATLVSTIMVEPVLSVGASAPLGDALEILLEKRLLAVPVVDEKHRLCGVLDLSAFNETLASVEGHQTAEAMFQIIGVQIRQEEERNILRQFRKRFPWLMCNIASGFAAAFIVKVFEAALHAVAALAFFVPLVLTLAESIA